MYKLSILLIVQYQPWQPPMIAQDLRTEWSCAMITSILPLVGKVLTS